MLEQYLDGHTEAGKLAGATWVSWYSDRHKRFEIPVNKYTRALWELKPEWNPEQSASQPSSVDCL